MRSVRDCAAISRAVLSELHENGGVESRSPPPASRRLRLAGRSLPGQRQLLAQAHCVAQELLVYIELRGWSLLSFSPTRSLYRSSVSFSNIMSPVLFVSAYGEAPRRFPSTESRVFVSYCGFFLACGAQPLLEIPLCRRKRGKSRRRIRRCLTVRRIIKKGGALRIFFLERSK